MHKRGGAQEFIMTYGWFILVFIGVISALAYFGIFDGKKGAPDVCMVGPGFGCRNYKATPDTFQITLQNGGIRMLSSVNIGFEAPTCTGATSANPADQTFPAIGTLTDKWWFNTSNVTILETKNIADFTLTGCSNTGRTSLDFSIEYIESWETVTHQVTGQANMKVDS